MLLQSKRVFIVEDNLENLQIMQTLLEREGAEIAHDNMGRNMFPLLQKFGHVDIILLDLMYPSFVDGYGLFQKLRELREFRNIPVVAVSAIEPSMGIARAKANGFSSFISKPVDFDLFPQQIASILNGQAVWGGN